MGRSSAADVPSGDSRAKRLLRCAALDLVNARFFLGNSLRLVERLYNEGHREIMDYAQVREAFANLKQNVETLRLAFKVLTEKEGGNDAGER